MERVNWRCPLRSQSPCPVLLMLVVLLSSETFPSSKQVINERKVGGSSEKAGKRSIHARVTPGGTPRLYGRQVACRYGLNTAKRCFNSSSTSPGPATVCAISSRNN